jgi:hypothetical protein
MKKRIPKIKKDDDFIYDEKEEKKENYGSKKKRKKKTFKKNKKQKPKKRKIVEKKELPEKIVEKKELPEKIVEKKELPEKIVEISESEKEEEEDFGEEDFGEIDRLCFPFLAQKEKSREQIEEEINKEIRIFRDNKWNNTLLKDVQITSNDEIISKIVQDDEKELFNDEKKEVNSPKVLKKEENIQTFPENSKDVNKELNIFRDNKYNNTLLKDVQITSNDEIISKIVQDDEKELDVPITRNDEIISKIVQDDEKELFNDEKKEVDSPKVLKKEKDIIQTFPENIKKKESDSPLKKEEDIQTFPENSKDVYLKKQQEFINWLEKEKRLENEEAYLDYFKMLNNKGFKISTLFQIYGI